MPKGRCYVTDLLEYIKEFIMSPSIIIIGSITLIEITPIKVNPWKWLFLRVGDLVNGDMRKDLAELKRDFEKTKAQNKRWHILNFARSCRQGEGHTKEEWNHAITELREYEIYTENKKIVNGVIEENAKYLRELYHDRLKNNDFL